MSAARPLLAGLLLGMLAGCSPSRQPADADTTSGMVADAPGEPDSAAIVRLEREARALARATGCDDASSCRAAPVGARPCGGPRDYVVWCARTTDSAALFRTLDSLRLLEARRNRESGAMGTCELREPPAVGASGGSCRATP